MEKSQHRWLQIICLFFAAESIYMLPYMRKTFQTSMQDVFMISSSELGLLNTSFGILALLSYFPSGYLADRFPTRDLLCFSLSLTGLLGLYTATLPGATMLLLCHALMGFSTILTFWAPLIKATRAWGPKNQQGKAFGILDSGRGLVAAILASIATLIFSLEDSIQYSIISVITFYSIINLLAAVVVWGFIPKQQARELASPNVKKSEHDNFVKNLKSILTLPSVWKMGLIIFCSYTLFLASFDFPAFAEVIYNKDRVFSATLATIRDWVRPFAALGAGLLADKINPSKALAFCFAMLIMAFFSLVLLPTKPQIIWILWTQILCVAVAIFSLRAIYFAVMEEVKIPQNLTGTTVGVISLFGFAPDVFIHALSGFIRDIYPDRAGFNILFSIMVFVATIGFSTSLLIIKQNYRYNDSKHKTNA